MKCYYEILELPREADEGEIKTAYRKFALKWHPDKNINNTEQAKEQFQLVQQAYEVLSDRQERAWYDNHREQILHGSDANYQDDSLGVFPYFTTQCFKGYGDDDKGFYTVYRTVFEKLAHEDIEYMDSKSDYDAIPHFGTSSSDYDDIVGPFYNYWMSYTTRKSYVWLDPYNFKETRERRVMKLIEKENKKVRQKAKKERNDEIRNLVAFVRKRDKRVQAYVKQLEARNIENRQKQEQLRKQKILERTKELNNDKQAEWSKFANVQLQLKEIEKHLAAQFGECISDSETNSEEEEYTDLYCVACNKLFKNPKAFANHESSKKHRDNTEKLKLEMEEEEESYENEYIEDEEDIEEIEVDKPDKLSDEDLDDLSDLEEVMIQSSKKKNKKNKKVLRVTHESISEDKDLEKETSTISDGDNFDFGSSKKSKKKNKSKQLDNKTNGTINDEKETQIEEEFETNTTEQQNRNDDFGTTKKSKKKTKPKANEDVNNENETNKTATVLNENKTPIVTAKIKKSKLFKIKTVTASDIEELDLSHCCVICKSNFNSKNKLFEHLKKTGHSVLLPQKATKSKKKLVK